MPAGRDTTGLDGAAWENLSDLVIAKRRESATGAEAISQSTYSQVTMTKSKTEKVIPTETGALSLFSAPRPRENEEEILSRIKMDKNEEKAVGKANEEKTVSKADGTSAAELLDLPLMHILTALLGMKLNGHHARV